MIEPERSAGSNVALSREPDRESGRPGRRGLGASEERSRAERGEHRTGPQEN